MFKLTRHYKRNKYMYVLEILIPICVTQLKLSICKNSEKLQNTPSLILVKKERKNT